MSDIWLVNPYQEPLSTTWRGSLAQAGQMAARGYVIAPHGDAPGIAPGTEEGNGLTQADPIRTLGIEGVFCMGAKSLK